MIKKYIKKSIPFRLIRYLYYHVYLKGIFLLEELIYKKSKINTNKIVVDNFAGRGFGDNPKYIVKELLKRNSNLDIVWQVSDMNLPMPSGVRKVKYRGPKAYKELLTAGIWIDNIKNSFKPDKRKDQFYLQTWHGGLAVKAIEKQVAYKLNSEYVKAAKRDARMTDLMLSDSNWTTNQYSKYFWYHGKIFKTGFPRNDILINQPQSIVDKVYKKFNIPKENKILLYAPTFRDNNTSLTAFKFDFKLIIESLKLKFKSKYVLLVRLHPNIAQLISNSPEAYDPKVKYYNASNYSDMQELLLATDVLITDYSSCMFDAMLAKKKVFLLAKDYFEYSENDRDLLFDIKKDLPFSFSDNEIELINNINNFEAEEYLRMINIFEKHLDLVEDGKASSRVAEIIQNKMGGQ